MTVVTAENKKPSYSYGGCQVLNLYSDLFTKTDYLSESTVHYTLFISQITDHLKQNTFSGRHGERGEAAVMLTSSNSQLGSNSFKWTNHGAISGHHHLLLHPLHANQHTHKTIIFHKIQINIC